MGKSSDTSIIRGAHAADARLRLIAAREGEGWTQRELAERTGWNPNSDVQPAHAMSPSRISNYEQGTRTIGPEEAAVFARVFDVAATWFAGMSNREETVVLGAQRGHRGEIHEPQRVDRSPSPLQPRGMQRKPRP